MWETLSHLRKLPSRVYPSPFSLSAKTRAHIISICRGKKVSWNSCRGFRSCDHESEISAHYYHDYYRDYVYYEEPHCENLMWYPRSTPCTLTQRRSFNGPFFLSGMWDDLPDRSTQISTSQASSVWRIAEDMASVILSLVCYWLLFPSSFSAIVLSLHALLPHSVGREWEAEGLRWQHHCLLFHPNVLVVTVFSPTSRFRNMEAVSDTGRRTTQHDGD